MNVIVNAAGWTLIHFLWQGLVLGCATALALAALHKAGAGQRYLVACVGLLACFAWPALELYGRLTNAHVTDAAAMAPAGLLNAHIGADNDVLALLQQHLLWVVGFWAMCAALLSLRLALGLLWIGRIGRAGERVDASLQARLNTLAEQIGVGCKLRLRVVDNLASPLTAGWLRPVVLVPAALLTGMSPELLDALLAHEIAHIRRHDYFVNLLQNVIETLLFYHPAAWWISGRIRIEREQIADDIAARALGAPRRLALALSELERLQFSGQRLTLAANGGELAARVQRLLRPSAASTNWRAAIPLIGIAATCVAIYSHASATVDVRPARTGAVLDFSHCAKPEWPKAALRAGETGAVTMKFTIEPDGKVSGSEVRKSSGHRALDEAARKGISACAFKPATIDGKPVASSTMVQYVWTLN